MQPGRKAPNHQQDGAGGQNGSSTGAAPSSSDGPWYQQHVSGSGAGADGANGYASSTAGQPARSDGSASSQRHGSVNLSLAVPSELCCPHQWSDVHLWPKLVMLTMSSRCPCVHAFAGLLARRQQTTAGSSQGASVDQSRQKSQKHKLLPHRQHSPPRLHPEGASLPPPPVVWLMHALPCGETLSRGSRQPCPCRGHRLLF